MGKTLKAHKDGMLITKDPKKLDPDKAAVLDPETRTWTLKDGELVELGKGKDGATYYTPGQEFRYPTTYGNGGNFWADLSLPAWPNLPYEYNPIPSPFYSPGPGPGSLPSFPLEAEYSWTEAKWEPGEIPPGNYREVLEDLMWILSVAFNMNTQTIEGTIKSPETANTWDEHVAGLSIRYGVIIRRLEEAGAYLLRLPQMTLTGHAYGKYKKESTVVRHDFTDIEAEIRIEVDLNRSLIKKKEKTPAA